MIVETEKGREQEGIRKGERGGKEEGRSDPERRYLLCTDHFVAFFSDYRTA